MMSGMSAPPPLSLSHIEDGKYTHTVYLLIRDGNFADAIRLLGNPSPTHNDRASLSLQAWCHYQQQNWDDAARCYEQLLRSNPDVEHYHLYYAQCLYKAGQHQPAQKACLAIDNSQSMQKFLKIQAAIYYEINEINACRATIEQCNLDDPDTIVNLACLHYKDGNYDLALQKFKEALNKVGNQTYIQYYIAVCYYQMKLYIPSLKHVADIIENGVQRHPDITAEGIEVRSIANIRDLHESYLIEALNLKAAIEYQLKNAESAKECLHSMPARLEEELDPVTLHNHALINIEDDPSAGFEKFIYLLQQSSCPPETFGNLLLLYLKYEYYDAAADFLAENSAVARTVMNQYMFDFISAVLYKVSTSEEASKMLDDLADNLVTQSRKLTKEIQEARHDTDDTVLKQLISNFTETIEKYIPVLMQQAKVYWDLQDYSTVENIFRKSMEFCSEHDTWRLNVAHVLFMQEKYKEAITFYEPIVKKLSDKLLLVPAIVLANLCVSYIMTSQNEEAEELMKRIEKEEERISLEDPVRRTYHLCIVNLIIGTLYCAKGNYEFGIGRVMKSLDPMSKKLGTDTWFYTKRCFCSLFETIAKQMIVLKDSVYYEIMQFLDNVELNGRSIPAVIDPLGLDNIDPTGNYVALEARYLKVLFLKLYQ